MKLNFISTKSFLILSITFTFLILSLSLPSSTKAQNILFQDDFNDGNANSWEEFYPQGYWKVENGKYIGSCVSLGLNERQSYSLAGDKNWKDYVFEVDIRGVDGIDKEILFRVNVDERAYVLNLRSSYFGGGNDLILAKRMKVGYEQVTLLKAIRYTNYTNTTYKIKVEVKNINSNVSIKVYIDNSISPVLEYIDSYKPILSGSIGLEVWPGGYRIPTTGLRTTTAYGNVKVYTYFSEAILNVPDLKQYSSPWGQLEYDTASKWYPKNPTISRWGCALTSASMVLKYYDHDINPDALNEWLTYQKDGFSRNGGIIWPSITRLTELRNSGNRDWPILEFSYLNYAENSLKNEIQNERPGILKLTKPIYDNEGNIISYSTHFIVGKGYDEENIFVNDPGKDGHTKLSQANSYWGTTSKIGRFKKSETDLSYIVLFVDDEFDLVVSSESGKITGDKYYFKEYPITDPDDPDSESGVETLNAFYYPKPESGNYTVEIKGDGVYRLDYYIYDEKGNVKTGNSFGAVKKDDIKTYIINFDKIDIGNSSVPDITYESTLSFWKKAYDAGYIENYGLYISVKKLLENSYKISSRNITASKSLLEEIIAILEGCNSKSADEQLIAYFKYQIEVLLSSL